MSAKDRNKQLTAPTAPQGCELNPTDHETCRSFAEMLEASFAKGERFMPFLWHVVNEEWKVSPESFRNTLIRNLDAQLARASQDKDFDPAKLPQAMQRYMERRDKLSEDNPNSPSRPPIPTTTIIKNWFDGVSEPNSTQMILMSIAFGLTPRQEHMLWKGLLGKKLALPEVRLAIRKGNSAHLARLLIRASGFPEPRLAELLGVGDTTVHGWADWNEPHRIDDNEQGIETAMRFAKLMTQCLDIPEGELKSWLMAAVQRDIASVMTGRALSNRPGNSKEAAVRFQEIFEDAYDKGQSFSEFLQRVTREWDVPLSYLGFLNENNAKHDKAYEPISERSLSDWHYGHERPRAGRIEKIASGAFMDLTQELKLWQMTHSERRITAEEVKALIKAGNSAILLTTLIEVSGIGRSRLFESVKTDSGTLDRWTNKTKPQPVHQKEKANTLADYLLPLVVWPENTPPEEVETLRQDFINCIQHRKSLLYEMVVEALDDPKPHARMIHLLCDQTELSNDELAKKLEITTSALCHYKSGARTCSEDDAHKFINLLDAQAREDKETVLEAVNVLTCTLSPSELLNRAEEGKLWIGKVYEQTAKRRHIPRSYMAEQYGLSNYIMSRFEDDAKGQHYLELKAARDVSGFIGFEGDERRRFVLLATGQKLEKIPAILADAEALRCANHETMDRLCAQTSLTNEEVAEVIGIPAQQLADYRKGKLPEMELPKEALEKLGDALCLAPDAKERVRLQGVFMPGATRVMHMVEVGHMSRAAGLQRLLDLADIRFNSLETMNGGTRTINSAADLLKHPELPYILKTIGSALQLQKSELASLHILYDPAHGHDESKYPENIRKQKHRIISEMMDAVHQRHGDWEKTVTDSAPWLEVWDEFAAQVRTDKQDFQIARALLAGEPTTQYNDMIITSAFQTVAEHIGHVSSPEKGVTAKQWQGEIYDAINRLLFQRLCACRKELGLPDIAAGPDEARDQKKKLFHHPLGKKILTAVMATNNGYMAHLASPLRNIRQYRDKVGFDSAVLELWMGREGAEEGIDFVGGGLASFLRWNPQISRFSTFVTIPVNDQIRQITMGRKKRDVMDESTALDPVVADDGSNSGMLRNASYCDYLRKRSELEGGLPKMTDEMAKIVTNNLAVIEDALSLLPDRERILLSAIFKGSLEGKTPTNEEVAPLISDNPKKPISRERVRQIRDKATDNFMYALQRITGAHDHIPAKLARLLGLLKEIGGDEPAQQQHGPCP